MIPEHIRQFVVILALAIVAFGLMRHRIVGALMDDREFVLRCSVWLAVTSAAFLSHNFWIFVIATAIVLMIAVRRDTNPLALYAFLMLALPPMAKQIPGFGLVNYLIAIDYLRLLSLVVLVAALPRLRFERWMPTDFMILAYLVIQIALRAPVDTTTNTLRTVVNMLLDIVLPYYVASRSLRSLKEFRDVLVSFAAGAAVVAVIAMFEVSRSWMLYSSLDRIFDIDWGYGNYLRRDGHVRANASTGQSIVLGYVMVVALLFWGAQRPMFRNPNWWWVGTLGLLGGAVASLSRGPLVALIIGWVIFRMTGPNAAKGLSRLALSTVIFLGMLALSPLGDSLKEYLPFVGEVDAQNVDYRRVLFDVSVDLIVQSPWAGVPGFYGQLADAGLVQGEGIVDLVNSYVAIALAVGVPALGFFVAAFVTALWPLLKVRQWLPPDASMERTFAAALMGALIATMVTIATVSSILAVPYVYWSLIGLAVALAGLIRQRHLAWMGVGHEQGGQPGAAGHARSGTRGATASTHS